MQPPALVHTVSKVHRLGKEILEEQKLGGNEEGPEQAQLGSRLSAIYESADTPNRRYCTSQKYTLKTSDSMLPTTDYLEPV